MITTIGGNAEFPLFLQAMNVRRMDFVRLDSGEAILSIEDEDGIKFYKIRVIGSTTDDSAGVDIQAIDMEPK